MKVRVTMDSGAAGHVIPKTMFPRVKLERKTSQTRVAANGEQVSDLGEKTIPFKTIEGVRRCITFIQCECLSNLSFQYRKLSDPETLWCWMKKIRTLEILETER